MMENSLQSTEVWVLPSKTEQELSSRVYQLKSIFKFDGFKHIYINKKIQTFQNNVLHKEQAI